MNKPDPKMMKLFLYYIEERHRIHEKKERGDPWPWTNDEILQTYRFTNVYRAWDRTTKHFVAKLYDPHYDAPADQIALNCAAARFFGTTEYADRIGWLEEFKPDQLLADVKAVRAAGVKIFTNAYVVTNNGIKAPKEEVVVLHFLTEFHKRIPDIVAASQSGYKQRVHRVLSKVEGFGGTGFMAKEVIEDMCLTKLLRDAVDADTYTPMGPGARDGLERLYGDDADACTMLERVRYLRDQIQQQLGLPMTAHDVQFNLCELSKYIRAKNGEKMKRKYKPPVPVRQKGHFFAA